ncbi:MULTISPECIES: DUF5336 domain-containing protein [Mycolicibacter]|uniref:Transmembrane protein n=1 Tax=Mycolicibacter virginiensis TaxID=1795032 RepID=A0A9X7IPS6_9MYCO|nr:MULTISPECIES: DUF5336 domain-containing protein [Mycobacteriaceae]OBG42117.1 hypothetical protein A5671_11570 [Mycolicibacter heraklionensis]PQM53117.1 hypothetical protein C5U48_05655 [Mycolicibacter virginiensis]
MTYSPGNPGFQPSQPSGSYGQPTPSFAKSGGEVESKVPQYLRIAVVALGLGVYLANFGPIVTITDVDYPLILSDAGHTVPLAVLAALLAGAALLPKARSYTAVVAVVSALGALLAISTVADASGSYTIGWGLWLILIFSVLQAAAAVGSLLLEAGVVTAPAPRPKYDPYAQYGLPPGGNYYGQPGQQGYGHQGHQGQQAPQQPGYPSSYGSYPSAPSSGGFGAQQAPSSPSTGGFNSGGQQAAPQGPPTPPTGFPSYNSPSSGGSGSASTGGHSAAGSDQSSTGGQQSQGGSTSSGPAQP